jgi:hypothetical protein
MACGIDWQPIAIVPCERKDGRHLLLWQGEAFIGRWVTDADHAAWATVSDRIITPTHWADVNPPK